MKKISPFAVLPLLAALAGCGSNPPYERPQLPLPDAWQTPLPQDTSSLQSSDDWWQNFHDPELEQLLQRALKNNPDLRIAVDHLLAAGADVRLARAQEYPSITFNAGPTDPVILRLANEDSHSHVDDSHYEVGLNAAYEIDFWGRVSNSIRAAHSEYVASAYDVDTARIALLSSVARAYFDLREADEMLALAMQKADLANQRMQLLDLKLRAGRTIAGTVADAHLLAQDAQVAVADLHQQRQLALQKLRTLLGDTAESLQIETAALRARVTAPAPAPGLPSTLLERRADIRAAEERLEVAQAKVAVAHAQRFPQVQLTAEFGFLTAAVVHILHAGSALVGIGPGVALPLFDGGRSTAELALRTHEYDAAQAEYQKAVLAAFADVENALLGYQSAVEAGRRWSTAAAIQATQLRDMQLLLAAGHADRFGLIDAQQRAIEIQLSSLIAYRRHLESMIALYQALGGAASSNGDAAAAANGATADDDADHPTP